MNYKNDKPVVEARPTLPETDLDAKWYRTII